MLLNISNVFASEEKCSLFNTQDHWPWHWGKTRTCSLNILHTHLLFKYLTHNTFLNCIRRHLNGFQSNWNTMTDSSVNSYIYKNALDPKTPFYLLLYIINSTLYTTWAVSLIFQKISPQQLHRMYCLECLQTHVRRILICINDGLPCWRCFQWPCCPQGLESLPARRSGRPARPLWWARISDHSRSWWRARAAAWTNTDRRRGRCEH